MLWQALSTMALSERFALLTMVGDSPPIRLPRGVGLAGAVVAEDRSLCASGTPGKTPASIAPRRCWRCASLLAVAATIAVVAIVPWTAMVCGASRDDLRGAHQRTELAVDSIDAHRSPWVVQKKN
jgi:hypothetical protein